MNAHAPLVAILALSSLALACSTGGDGSADPTASTDEAVVTKCSGSHTVRGVDVSHYNGSYDWHAAKANGIEFGYASIGDGSYVDPTFQRNYGEMRSAGVLRGAYIYFEPNQDVDAQANRMVRAVGHLGRGDLPAMIDVETARGEGGGTVESKVRRWLDIVERGTGKRPIIYTGPYFWQDSVGSALAKYDLWTADYGPSCPLVPDGWPKWTFWQYSDAGGLDRDVFNGTLADLEKLGGASTPGKPPAVKAPAKCGWLNAGEGLKQGEKQTSCNGRYRLEMQGDGNFVLYDGGKATWATRTNDVGVEAVMQGDGNFVIYDKDGYGVWASHTSGNGGAALSLQDDGNAVVYRANNGGVLWASNTRGK